MPVVVIVLMIGVIGQGQQPPERIVGYRWQRNCGRVISQLAASRVNKVTDVVKEGDKVKVKLLGFDDRGKVRLSMKVVDQTTGEDLEKRKSEDGEPPREAAGGAE